MRIARLFLPWLVLLSCPGQIFSQTQDDFADLATQLAPEISSKIIAKQGTANYKVAAFPFGDQDGMITIQFNEPSMVFQGELINALKKLAGNKYLPLDSAALKRVFSVAGNPPADGISSSDPAATAMLLKKLKINAAIVGSIQAKSASQVQKDGATKINVSVTIVYDDGTTDSLAGATKPDSIPDSKSGGSGRFSVQLLLGKDDANLKPLDLVTSKDPDSGLYNVFFAILPDDLPLGDNEKACYRIRIMNKGTPGLAVINPNDDIEKNRLYGVAVLVDGVNSFYQNVGNSQLGPVVVHPKNARKWLLSGPNKVIVKDSTKPDGFRLVPVQNVGHSVMDIKGFQQDAPFADSFVFSSAKDSLAEAVGITNDIGLITVHFYPEDLPGDFQPKKFEKVTSLGPNTGTKPGLPVSNPIITVNPKLKKNPVEVWRIFYRKKADIPIPPPDQVSVFPATTEP